jgi:hypothetical protein
MQLDKPSSRMRRTSCEDSIRMNRREIGWEGVDWMYVAQNKEQ